VNERDLAIKWQCVAMELREMAGFSAATQNKLRRARADQLDECAAELLSLLREKEER
jgi:hypothetical protein